MQKLAGSRAYIRVKRMGDLDGKPFLTALKSKYASEEAVIKAIEKTSLWDDHLRDPSWHPYKMVMVNEEHKVWFFICVSHEFTKHVAFLCFTLLHIFHCSFSVTLNLHSCRIEVFYVLSTRELPISTMNPMLI